MSSSVKCILCFGASGEPVKGNPTNPYWCEQCYSTYQLTLNTETWLKEIHPGCDEARRQGMEGVLYKATLSTMKPRST